MKKALSIILILLISANISAQKIAFAIHGGAGTITAENITAKQEAEIRAKLKQALLVGYKVLQDGGKSVDACCKAITVLEDSPLFNAGKGAVFTNNGENELDCSIMDGENLNAGAASGLKRVKNPILLAKEIMINSDHVFLSGSGAEKFAALRGLEIVEPSYFFTEERFKSLEKAKENEKLSPDYKFGTVGAVALDKKGNLAAATSTGGMTNKKYGRIGDSPIIGAGTYANNNTCAVSCTGHGEYFIRIGVAKEISSLMLYKNLDLKKACDMVVNKYLQEMGGTGGVIAIDKSGNICLEFNTEGMYRASVDVDGNIKIEIFK